MPIKYIGRKTDFLGKPLWEIVGNLRDQGAGRLVVRSMFKRYPEVSYMKILKVLPYPYGADEDPIKSPRKVVALVDRVFRGRHIGVVKMDASTYKPDYVLVPKDEEHHYLDAPLVEEKKFVVPREMEFPPLLKAYLAHKAKKDGIKEPPETKLPLVYKPSRYTRFRVAEVGEEPEVKFVMGLGKPASPILYENIRYPETETDRNPNGDKAVQ